MDRNDTMLSKLLEGGTKYARNPLGIIALFIVLVYGIAGYVFRGAAVSLVPGERWPFVWFIVLFPVVVLLAFYRLVAKHHTKLYAPADFGEKDGFCVAGKRSCRRC